MEKRPEKCEIITFDDQRFDKEAFPLGMEYFPSPVRECFEDAFCEGISWDRIMFGLYVEDKLVGFKDMRDAVTYLKGLGV